MKQTDTGLRGALLDAAEAVVARQGVANLTFDAVAAEAGLNQRDGMHPTAAGVDAIVARILPTVEALVARVRDKRVM